MYHKNLEVWKDSIEFVKDIYLITSTFPQDEKFGIVSQMRRAAVSIPSNIAEGNARLSAKEAVRFIDIAIGSIAELDTQLIISKKLDFIDDECEVFQEKLMRINAMAIGLRNSLAKKD